jgi:proliferating cell nuclear antigen
MSEIETVPTENKFCVDASTLYEIFSYTSTLVNTVTFEVDNDGWKIRTMDPSNISLLDIFVPKTYLQLSTDFEYHKIDGGYRIGLCCNEVANLLKIFKTKRRYDDNKVTVTIDKQQNKFIVSNETTTQSIRMIEAGSSNCPLPKLNFNAEFSISGEAFLNALQSIEKASEYVTFTLAEPKYINEEGLIFTLEGKGDSAEVVNTLKIFDPVLKEKEGSQSATYSLDYLIKQIKIMKTTRLDLKIQFSTKMPLLITFANQSSHFYVAYYLAPRVQD